MADPSIPLEPPLDFGAPERPPINITGYTPGTPTREVSTHLMRPGQLIGKSTFTSRNIQDVPLNVTEGVPALERLSLDFKREPDQKNFLERVYGQGNVRKADTGDWIVRRPDELTGKLTDYTVNPTDLDKGDALALIPMARDVALWTLGGMASKGLPLVGKSKGLIGALRNVFGGAAAVEGGGAVTDVGSRLIEGQPVNFGEILRSRAMMGALDVGIGAVGETAGGFMRFMRNPYANSRTAIQIDGQAARDYLAGKYGPYVDLTPGELTGSPVLTRKESYMQKVPGSSAVYQQMLADRNANMERLSNTMMGTELPENDILGSQAIRALQAKTAPTEQGLAGAKLALADSALKEINSAVSSSTLEEGQFTRTYVGDAIRNKITALRDSAKASVDAMYAKVRALGGTDPIFSADTLAGKAREMYQSLPPQFKQRIESSPEGVMPFAQFSTSTTIKEPSTAFASETHILSKLRELMNAKGQNFSLSDLQQMRREVYDDMTKGEAVPGLSTHYLSNIGSMLTQSIEDGVANLPAGELKTALEAANEAYKTRLLPFNQKGITEVFNPISERAFIGPAELASRLTSGPSGTDKFNTLKGLLGADSMEIGLLKRQMADEVIAGGMEPGANLLNAQKMINSLQKFKDNNRDMYNEVFGKTGDKIMSEAKLANIDELDKVPTDVVENYLRGTSPTAQKLKDAIAAQREVNVTYKNTILNGVRSGKFDATAIRPSEFVSRMMGNATPSEIEQVMQLLSDRPALVEDIKSSTLQKVFADSRDSGKTVSEVLMQSEKEKSVKAILGDATFHDLQQFGFMQRTIAAAKTGAEMAGAMAASKSADEILMHPLKYTSKYVREFVTSTVLTSKPLMRWASAIPPSEPSSLYVMLSSPPFIRAVMDEFGPEQGRAFMSSLKTGLDQYTGSLMPGSRKQTPVTPKPSAGKANLEPALNF